MTGADGGAMRQELAPLAGVVGWPVGHSLSPAIFAQWFARYGVEGQYLRLPVREGDLGVVVAGLTRAGFCGVNVTIPHKVAAAALADERSAAVEATGAANLLVFETTGSVRADNTDVSGFLSNLRQSAPAWRPEAGPALVLGAGGAARAVLQALLEAGVRRIFLANRTAGRAGELAARFGEEVEPVAWGEREDAIAAVRLVVNATCLGMTGAPPLPLRLDAAQPGTVVADLVYRPLETPLLAAARARGLTVVDGLGMLLHQARPAFRAWFGTDPEVDEALRRAVLEAAA